MRLITHFGFVMSCILAVSILTLPPPVCMPSHAASPSAAKGGEAAKSVVVHGKIVYVKYLGGYVLQTENPQSELMIVNRNRKMLRKLRKTGATVRVEGHYTISADHLFIEKIDGKAYSAR